MQLTASEARCEVGFDDGFHEHSRAEHDTLAGIFRFDSTIPRDLLTRGDDDGLIRFGDFDSAQKRHENDDGDDEIGG